MSYSDPQAITLKTGTGAGNYSSSSTSYVDVDGTNLAYTVTIPKGFKLSVLASGSLGVLTGIANVLVAILDGSVRVERQFTPASSGAFTTIFSLPWVITGDGASHTIKLQYKTLTGADSVVIENSSATLAPNMVFTLIPSA